MEFPRNPQFRVAIIGSWLDMLIRDDEDERRERIDLVVAQLRSEGVALRARAAQAKAAAVDSCTDARTVVAKAHTTLTRHLAEKARE